MAYKLVGSLGRGGFGVVEEVENDAGVKFAMKTFSPNSYIDVADYDKLRTRFKREVKTQKQLGGNEIIPVLDSDLTGNNPWFVMPLASKTYDKQVVEDRGIGVANVDAIADILNALQFLHDMGYVHRDLNPKNILFHDGRWKLSDFGAVLPPSEKTVTLTDHTVIYTEQYCSPEQRQDFHSALPSADVYSFGCILHDLFGSGTRTPYARHTGPGTIGVLIERCTELRPAKRPNISKLRDILLGELSDIGGQCKIEDKRAVEWLRKIEKIEDWNDSDFESFAAFFRDLDVTERTQDTAGWVYSLSTPFLTRLTSDSLIAIAQRNDGIAIAVLSKYCDWAGSTDFLFPFADTVCSRLCAIFDNGDIGLKSRALLALVNLGCTHSRWHVMRETLRRCGKDRQSKDEAKRFVIEVKIEDAEGHLKNCVEIIKWDIDNLVPEIAALCR